MADRLVEPIKTAFKSKAKKRNMPSLLNIFKYFTQSSAKLAINAVRFTKFAERRAYYTIKLAHN